MKRSVLPLGVSLLLASLGGAGCGGGGQTSYSGPGTGGDMGAGGTGDTDAGAVGPGGSITVAVNAAANFVTLANCAFQPAQLPNVPAGSYTITLTASTLTKGGVSGPRPAPASADNYVIVYVPLPPGAPNENHRFFMLNGTGASAPITLPAAATIQVMFVDSDTDANAGTGTVTLSPGGMTATVDAVANDLAYDTKCHSMPATQVVVGGTFNVKLLDSAFSSGGGAHDDFVLVRTPSEQPMNDHRYVILNGDGANQDFTPYNSQTVRLWYIGAGPGTGIAHVAISAK
jgi:hypothetical protein